MSNKKAVICDYCGGRVNIWYAVWRGKNFCSNRCVKEWTGEQGLYVIHANKQREGLNEEDTTGKV